MITVDHLTKKYGSKVAVNNLSFTVQPGRVTGFLGPNGSGKSTTMRCIVGLDSPTSGHTSIDGVEYSKLTAPITKVGALLDGKAFHPGRSARGHLRIVAATHGIPKQRVEEVLEFTGIAAVANKRFKSFSLGMGQRLGIALALLGDPEVLLFDEPVNGLDPDGVRWVRSLMRDLAAQGRTVLVSSHLMSEMALTADDLVIIGKGSLIDAGPITQFTESAARSSVRVAGPDALAIGDALRGANMVFDQVAPEDKFPMGSFQVKGVSRGEIGHLLHQAGVEIHELSELHSSLEDVFMELTADQVEYTTTQGGAR
ncbi:ABC-2 type transport system ATP-binding protein [Arcanobacterium wilhelmae]|uniref:ABC-2 type transport system ATP-binding protein n=1 Tax=Arcanobacterium wilhelmae TaxID=1803177 RepID=A0ABT9NC02_9ACTO|nr:ABC transporter ATP-binding protein [Arcanobacterium wilhelmae]MDP9801248.1 ABC-2 type transport system ATP-binding protein [Arcanobacterium wilhelmae]WFN90595.1 ABC transporter ATP-binding protein [Arcanobacterium wilhelmae]